MQQQVFGKNAYNGSNNTGNNTYGNSKYKYKPYRNRPSKRQACLELLSFLILVCAAPAFLGGVISIFVCIFGFVLGLLGLFAWTRRHAVLFAILSALLVALCIVNIVLRGVFVGQCMPFYQYSGLFSVAGSNIVSGNATVTNVTNVTNGFNVTTNSTTQLVNTTTTIFAPSMNATHSPGGVFVGGTNVHHNSDSYNQSIWCGNREIVYITNGIIILLAIPAHIIALCLLFRKNRNLRAQPVSNTTTTTTREAYVQQPVGYVQQPVAYVQQPVAYEEQTINQVSGPAY